MSLCLQAHYRLSLLTHLHQLSAHTFLNNHAQLQLTVETSATRLITGFGNSEIAPPKNQPQGAGQKSTSTLYGDSEELNRVVILTLARAVHVGGLEQVNTSTYTKHYVMFIKIQKKYLDGVCLAEGGGELYHAQHAARVALAHTQQLPAG